MNHFVSLALYLHRAVSSRCVPGVIILVQRLFSLLFDYHWWSFNTLWHPKVPRVLKCLLDVEILPQRRHKLNIMLHLLVWYLRQLGRPFLFFLIEAAMMVYLLVTLLCQLDHLRGLLQKFVVLVKRIVYLLTRICFDWRHLYFLDFIQMRLFLRVYRILSFQSVQNRRIFLLFMFILLGNLF